MVVTSYNTTVDPFVACSLVPFFVTANLCWLSLTGREKGILRAFSSHHTITLFSVPGRVLGHLLLMQVRSQLLKVHRREQSGFTPGRLTAEYELRQGMFAA